MAKLSARGRTCIVEVTREYTAEQLQTATDRRVARDYPDGTWTHSGTNGPEPIPDSIRLSLTVWERKTRRLMSDGKILEKLDVRFRPDGCTWDDARGRLHSYGWKVHGTLKPGITSAEFTRIYTAPSSKTGAPSTWTVTQGAIVPAVIISQRRIVRAVESGESIGFCTSCGADQLGVEPDAEGYRCEACGESAVKGAENLLLETAE